MENEPKFSLESSITQWRLMLTNDQNLAGDTVDELESHLLDEVSALKTSGLNDEEAFMVATKRMGHTDLIAAEFRKVHGDASVLDRIAPHLTGVLVLLAFLEVTRLLNNGIFFFTYKIDLAHYSNTTLIMVNMFLLVACVAGVFGFLLLRFKNKRLIYVFTFIPTLISVVVVGRVLNILFGYLFLNNEMPMEKLAWSSMNLNVLYMMLLLAFLIFSTVIFLRMKKKRRMTLTN